MRSAAPLLVLLLACGAPADPVEPSPPSILLVTLDTVRADRIGAYGYTPAGTPTLDRLAREGILFESALATAPITLPSHASILTGVDPPVHGVRDNGIFALAPEAVLVSEVLQRHGWRTGAFVGSYVLDARFGLDQGFEVYSAPALTFSGVKLLLERRADAVVGSAVAWLAELDPAERFFAWVHLYDPHADYDPPEPWAQRFEDPYDAEIAFSDAQLARLLRQLELHGLDENLLVVVTADHGESLGEHGEKTHGIFLYDATLRVPLLIAGAPVAGAGGTRVSRTVSNTAVAATLLTLAGLESEEMLALASPSLLTRDGAPAVVSEDRAMYLESGLPYYSYRWHALRGLVHGDHKLIEGREAELYDLGADPGEQTDLAATRPERLASMREQLRAVFDGQPAAAARSRSLQPGEREMLAELGYVAGDAAGDPYDPALPDPRALIGELTRYDEAAELYVEANRLKTQPTQSAWQRDRNDAQARTALRTASELLEPLMLRSPRSMPILHLLGLVQIGVGEPDAAVRTLEQLVRLYPRNGLGRYNLALAYFEAARSEDAVRALLAATELEPRQPAYPLRLAAHYAETGDAERAAHWLTRARTLAQETTPLWADLDALQARVDALRGS